MSGTGEGCGDAIAKALDRRRQAYVCLSPVPGILRTHDLVGLPDESWTKTRTNACFGSVTNRSGLLSLTVPPLQGFPTARLGGPDASNDGDEDAGTDASFHDPAREGIATVERKRNPEYWIRWKSGKAQMTPFAIVDNRFSSALAAWDCEAGTVWL